MVCQIGFEKKPVGATKDLAYYFFHLISKVSLDLSGRNFLSREAKKISMFCTHFSTFEGLANIFDLFNDRDLCMYNFYD